MAKKKVKKTNQKISSDFDIRGISNSLAQVVGANLNPYATPLSQLDPLFYNNRWQLLSNMRQVLSQTYAEHGLVQALVDIPVDDAFRGGIVIKSSQLDEDEITDIETAMAKNDDLVQVTQAFKWNRLFGGAGVMVLTEQEAEEHLDINKLDNMEFKAVDMWELFAIKQNVDYATEEGRLMPTVVDDNYTFDYYGKKIHNSRVFVTKGVEPPSFIRPRLRGWGLSVVEALVQSMNQHLKTKNLSYEVLDEFKLDIYKIKGFNQALITPGGTSKIQERVALGNYQKNYQNAITMDSEDDHQGKQLNFNGIADIFKEIRVQIACDMRMPMTKLFGLSASGFNSGEDDIEVYNGMVESTVRVKAQKTLLEVVRLRCHQLFGMVPDDLSIEFLPLRVMSSEQEELIKDSKMNRVIMALDRGLCSVMEAKESINRDDLLGIKVDIEQENIAPGLDSIEGSSTLLETKKVKRPDEKTTKTGNPQEPK